jgi:hypothetical protein
LEIAMESQPDKPIFTGRPPGKKLPTGLNAADWQIETPIATPVALERTEVFEPPTPQVVAVVEVKAPAEPVHPANTAQPDVDDRRRHRKTLLAAAALVTVFGAISGVALAYAFYGNSSAQSSLPAEPITQDGDQSSFEAIAATGTPSAPPSVGSTPEPSSKPNTKPSVKPSSRPTTKTSVAPEAPDDSETPRSPQIVTYLLKETQSCHAKVSAELQILTDGNWTFLANPDGWDRPAKCPDTNPYQPFVTKELLEGTTIRWRVYSSAWEWFSKPVTLR